MTAEPVVLVESQGGVWILTINRPRSERPQRGSAQRVSPRRSTARSAFRRARVLVFTGAGDKAFVAGADVAEFAGRSPLDQRRAMNSPTVFDRIWDSPLHDRDDQRMVPGRWMRAGAGCDVRVGRGHRDARSKVRLGIIPGGGATQRLPRLIGYGKALQLILSGETLDGVSAYEIGLSTKSCRRAAARTHARDRAGDGRQGPVTLAIAKRAVRAFELPLSARLHQERDLFALAFATEDKAEGVAAFLEKRKPEWRPGAGGRNGRAGTGPQSGGRDGRARNVDERGGAAALDGSFHLAESA